MALSLSVRVSRPCTCLYSRRPQGLPSLSRPVTKALAVEVVAFRDDSKSSRGQKGVLSSRASKSSPVKTLTSSKSTRGAKKGSSKQQEEEQRVLLGFRAPRNERENAESVLAFLAIASLFLTGVLFIVIPGLEGFFPRGTSGVTTTWQKGVNKTFGIKVPKDESGPGYAPGPGPAAAPGSPATRM